MDKKKIAVKVCQYYGAFSLGCKLLDRVFPEGTVMLDKAIARLEQKNARDRARRRRSYATYTRYQR